jgi:DNA topoisomerase-3
VRVVVCEKPSVAADLARVLGCRERHDGWHEGQGLRITWAFGHLAELEDPKHYNPAWERWSFDTLPMVPAKFALRLRADHDRSTRERSGPDRTALQFKCVQRLLRDRATTEVVNACDAGREGELIFRYLLELADCTKPSVRLWTSSLTDEAIRAAWSRLRPGGDYDGLGDAARSRSEADWLVGLNATRALTCLARSAGGEQLLSVGRVQTPTLAMIVARDRAIAAFVPESYWQVKGRFEAIGDAAPASWEATYFAGPVETKEQNTKEPREDDEAPRAERIGSAAVAERIAAAVQGRTGEITDAERRRTREAPPLLYDLTSLQRRANERYGMSAPDTLEIAQQLYEKKLLTYPRTDARYITPDQVGELPKILQGIRPIPVYAPFVDAVLANGPPRPGRRVVNAEEVGDHHAILPTGRTPDPAELSGNERRIFDLVARRLLAALSDDALFDVTTLVVAVEPDTPVEGAASPLRFRARGRVCRQVGWRAVDPPGRSRDLELPPVNAGDMALAADTRVHEGKTRPPRPHTDATLLYAMETAGKELGDAELARAMRHAGLGTPATRAETIQILLRRGYIIRDQRDLRATDKGRSLIDAVPVDELKTAALTGRWEAGLLDIAEGRLRREAFMASVVDDLRSLVEAIAAAPPPPPEVSERPASAVLGKCPKCGGAVREARSVFECEAGRSCGFVVFKTMSHRDISARMVRQLLADGKTPVVKGFRSKEGKEFSAGLIWQEGRVGFHFPPRGDAALPGDGGRDDASPTEKRSKKAEKSKPLTPVGLACPRCGDGRIVAGRAAWGCDRWREGCGFTLPFDEAGRRLTDAEAVARLRGR